MKILSKKMMLYAITFISVASLCSCSNSSDKIIIEKYENIDHAIYIDKDDLVGKLDRKETFLLYVGSINCSSCNAAKPFLEDYIKETNNIVYFIENIGNYDEVASITTNNSSKYNLPSIPYTPGFVIISNGKSIYCTNYNKDASFFLSLAKMKSQISKKVSSNGYYITNDLVSYTTKGSYSFYKFNYESTLKLDQTIASNKATILFSWFSCGDCSLLKNTYLPEYLKDMNKNKKLYVYEVNYYRSQNNDNPEIWTDFVKKYQFDNYRNGKVPSFVTYENSLKTSMAVFVNDVIDKETFKITESFWSEQMIGFSGNDYADTYKKAAKKEWDLIVDYLNSVL